jgi:hypothetical protein
MAKKSSKSRMNMGFITSRFPKPKRGLDDMELPKKGKVPLSKTLNSKFHTETLRNHLKNTVSDPDMIIDIAANAVTGAIVGYVAGKILPTDGGFDAMEKSPVYREESRIGSDMGFIYKKFIRITLGDKTDRQMKYAKGLYKVENWPSFDSKSNKYWKDWTEDTYKAFEALYSQAGEMRQGVWFPSVIRPDGSSISDWRDQALYQMWSGRLLTKMAMYYEIRQYLMTDADRTWLDQTDNMSADKFYAIDYIEDTVTIANGMEYSPVDLKIYLCKCKSNTVYSPAALWFNPEGENVPANLMRNDYVYDSTPDSSNLPSSAFADLSPVTHYGNASVHVGATPFYSSSFRNHWSVEEVIKQTILPTDKFELCVKRHMRKAQSVRELEQLRDPSGSAGGNNAPYSEGDYALLITFRGKPGFMRYTGTLDVGQEGLRETDVTPSKILVTSRSSFGIASPNLVNSDSTPGTSKQTENYIAGEGRVLDTELKTLDFMNADWKPEVITNVEVKEGGAR